MQRALQHIGRLLATGRWSFLPARSALCFALAVDDGRQRLCGVADLAVDRACRGDRLAVRRVVWSGRFGLARPAQARRAKHAARWRHQQHGAGPVHVRCAEPAAGLERALPRHVQHRSAPHLARLHHPRSARRAHRGRHLPARSRPLRRRAARGAQAGQDLPAATSSSATAASSRSSTSRSRAAAGWRRTRTSPSASAPSASSSRRARSSTRSSRTCRRRSS